MQGINFNDPTSLAGTSDKQRAAYLAQRRIAALHAVTAENKTAALGDTFEGSTISAQGSFRFDFSLETSSQITWQSSGQGTQLPAEYTSEFSLSLSISIEGQVALGEDVSADEQQISGQDFSFDRQGLLKLLEELAQKLGLDGEQQVDLGGKLDDQALSLLQRLGLIDENGQATPLLQFLSDYADLNRFQAGQQVSEPKATYGNAVSAAQRVSLKIMSQYQMHVQAGARATTGAAQPPAVPAGDGAEVSVGDTTTGGNVVNASGVNGGVRIDDRDTVNIIINNGANQVESK